MPLLLDLFLTFFKIGAVSFGGGYAMIPLVTDEVIAHGWLTYEQIMNFSSELTISHIIISCKHYSIIFCFFIKEKTDTK